MHEEFPHGEEAAGNGPPPAGDTPAPVNCSLVMVVASTAVNRVVVSRIVERAGLKVVACATDAAAGLLRQAMPCVVVAEEGAAEAERAAVRNAVEMRARSAAGLPLVVVLSRPGPSSAGRAGDDADAVVSMPITPDALAPVVLKLVERARLLSAS